MKKIIEKLKNNHMLLMLVCCLVPLAIVYAGIYFLGWSNSILTWSILLLCPLAHIFMMKGHEGHQGKKDNNHDTHDQ